MQKPAIGGLFFCLVPTCHPYNCTPHTALKTPAMGNLFRAARQVPYDAGVLAYRVGVVYMGTPIFALTKRAVCTEFPSNKHKKNHKSPFLPIDICRSVCYSPYYQLKKQLRKESEMTSLERLLGQSLGLRTRTRSQASIDAAKRERSYYSKAKRLATKMGVVIEVDRYMCPFGMTPTKWVYDGDDFEQKSGITQEEFERRWPDERGQVEWEVIYNLLHWTLVEGKPVSEYRGCSTM